MFAVTHPQRSIGRPLVRREVEASRRTALALDGDTP
jgi:hypothetical protein